MSEMWAAAKALVLYNNRVLIIRRSSYIETGAGEWDIPGGGMQFGETMQECLTREAKEETGLNVRVERLLFATTRLVTPVRQIIILVYLCHADSDEVMLSHEHTDYLWATPEQLKDRLSPSALAMYIENGVFDMLDNAMATA